MHEPEAVTDFDRNPAPFLDSAEYRREALQRASTLAGIRARLRNTDSSSITIPVRPSLGDDLGAFGTRTQTQAKLRDHLLAEIGKLTTQTWIPRLIERIKLLINEATESYPKESLVDPSSLLGFLTFLKSYPGLKYPDLSMTPSGKLHASWTTSPDRHLSLEFDKIEVKFVVFGTDPVLTGRVARITGRVSIQSVLPSLHPYEVKSLVFS